LRVTFRLTAPEAKKVQVVGNFGLGKGGPWEIKRGEDGAWEVTTPAVIPCGQSQSAVHCVGRSRRRIAPCFGHGMALQTTRARLPCTVLHGNPGNPVTLTPFMDSIECHNPSRRSVFRQFRGRALLNGVQEVGGSNPLGPTQPTRCQEMTAGHFFCQSFGLRQHLPDGPGHGDGDVAGLAANGAGPGPSARLSQSRPLTSHSIQERSLPLLREVRAVAP
jgi:hypothetical protein